MTTSTPTTSTSRLVVVSNRLPVTIKKEETGWTFGMSSGGLVSALSGLKKEMAFSWIGWPGLDVAMEDRTYVRDSLMDRYSCLPVFLSDEVADMHYNGFSNRYGIATPFI
jgi:trehalose-6-phosphate synthase